MIKIILIAIIATIGAIALFAKLGRLKWTAFVDDFTLWDNGLEVLLRPHEDYILPFKWVRRKWTAFLGPQPRKLAGSAPAWGHFDIPLNGTWVLAWPLYFALKTEGGWHWRIGFRPDYEAIRDVPNVVDYYNIDTMWPRNLDK